MNVIKQKYSFFFIETQFDNLGDAAINREMIKLMSTYSQVNLGISKVPLSFINMIGSDFLNSFSLDKKSTRESYLLKIILKRFLGNDCYLFLSPGGWIGELDGNLNLRSWFHAILYHFMHFIGVKIIQLGVSYEDLGPKLLKLTKFRSKAYNFHFVRDKLSQDYLIDNQISFNGICPDLAFNKFEEVNHQLVNKNITFSFRSDQYINQLDEIKEIINRFIKSFPENDQFQFVSQVEKDRNTNENLSVWVNQHFKVKTRFISASHSIDFVLNAYKKSNIIISNRLHALLLAGGVGNIMFAAPIGDNNKKIQSLFDDVGLKENVFKIEDQQTAQQKQLEQAMLTKINSKDLKADITNCFNLIFGTNTKNEK